MAYKVYGLGEEAEVARWVLSRLLSIFGGTVNVGFSPSSRERLFKGGCFLRLKMTMSSVRPINMVRERRARIIRDIVIISFVKFPV